MAEEQLFFNGIDAASGEYLFPPMTVEQLASLARSESPDEQELRRLGLWQQLPPEGPREGIDPRDLPDAGWGIIFAAQDQERTPAIRGALKELLEHRRDQAGERYQEFVYEPGQSRAEFLTRHGARPGPADPDKVPFYLLIAGDPEAIPYQFQQELGMGYAVGRIHFDRPEQYAQYARHLVAAETGQAALPRWAAFFGVQNPDDGPTHATVREFVIPLAERMTPVLSDWGREIWLAESATKDQLSQLLGGEQTPALLLAAGHGLGFASDHSLRRAHQGALLCQDWPGPERWPREIPPDFYFAGDDVMDDARLAGLVAFLVASYSAGTPGREGSQAQDDAVPQASVASLPQRLLGHPSGGALAVVGHADRVWGASSPGTDAGAHLASFETAFRSLVAGHPVGWAVEYINRRYIELAMQLNFLREQISDSQGSDALTLASLWTAMRDALSLIILGDPAARLPVAQPDEPAARRPAIEARSEAPEPAGDDVPGRWLEVEGGRLPVRTLQSEGYEGAVLPDPGFPLHLLPEEKALCELTLYNYGRSPWAAIGPEAIQVGAIVQPEDPGLAPVQLQRWPLRDPVHDMDHLPLTFTAPGIPGKYRVEWTLLRGEGTNTTILMPEKPATCPLEVVPLERLVSMLPELPDMRASEWREWINTIQRVVQRPDTDDSARRELVEHGLVPALFSPYVTVRRPAIGALYAIRETYPGLDDLLRVSVQDQPALDIARSLLADSRVSADTREWLGGLLPPEEKPDEDDPEALLAVLPALPDMPARDWRERIRAISRVVRQPDTDDAVRRKLVEEGLIPALYAPWVSVRRPALAALYALHEGKFDLDIETLLRESFKDSQANVADVRSLAGDPRVGSGAQEWLKGLLPAHTVSEAEKDRPIESPTDHDQTILLQARAEYRPPPVENLVTVEVSPTTAKLTYAGTEYSGPYQPQPETLLAAGADVRRYGEILFNSILHYNPSKGGVWERPTLSGYARALERTGDHLRLKLQLDPNDLRLHRHRWEYLKHPGEDTPLALKERSPFYRYLQGRFRETGDIRHMVPAKPLRVLAAVCNPSTLEEKGNTLLEHLGKLDGWREVLEDAFKPLHDHGVGQYRILANGDGAAVTLRALREALQEGGGTHVLHLVCHGLFIDNQYYLVMEDTDGRHAFVSASEFRVLMSAGEQTLRLVLLVACQSARDHDRDVLRGLGPTLVRAGVPAVVAMQDVVTMDTAQRFSQHFYDDLARSGRVDMAMAATRLALFQDQDADLGAWGIPALFMSTDDGQLFDVDVLKAAKDLPKVESPVVTHYPEAVAGAGVAGMQTTPSLESAPPPGSAEQALRSIQSAWQITLAGITPTVAGMPGAPAGAERLALGQDLEKLNDKIQHKVEMTRGDLKRAIGDQTPKAPAAGAEPPGEGGPGGEPKSRRTPRLELPPTVYGQIASALNTGKHIILIGAPGTGKTSLAEAICNYAAGKGFSAGTTFTTATADWTTFDTVGGYVPAADQSLQFRPGHFLEAIGEGKWLIIDEINRAEIDKAFGELFTVLSGQQVDLPYKVGDDQVRVLPAASDDLEQWVPEGNRQAGHDYIVHPNWRIIGTMNVYDKSSLFNISLAFMRRFAFVDVDLPEKQKYEDLRSEWLDKIPDLEAPDRQALEKTLDSLLEPGTTLMRRRELGPAIAKDMIAYIGNRHGDREAAETMQDLVAEAFLLYAVPQLDGLDSDAIGEIYTALSKEFEDAAETTGILPRIQALYPFLPPGHWKAHDGAPPAERGAAGGGASEQENQE